METKKEQPAEYYDKIYATSDYYKRKGIEAGHIHIWNKIIEKLEPNAKILELGCGTGQFAEVLIDGNFDYKLGIDFSIEAIKIAKSRFNGESQVNRNKFFQGDVLDSKIYHNLDYNVVIATEVFEHIEKDIELLNNLKKGTEIFLTVPDFGGVSHVRHFVDRESIWRRYSDCIAIRNVIAFRGKHTIWLVQAVKL